MAFSYIKASSTKCCTFCSNRHSPVNCKTYPSVSVRQDRLNELRRCYRCLKTGHIPPQCPNYIECRFCTRTSHHAALCCKNELTKDAEAPRSKNECANGDYSENLANKFKTRQCASQWSAPSSPSSGYCSDDFSEPEFTPASPSFSSPSFDNTWQHETRQNMPESKLHIWLGAKKRTPNQNRPITSDYTIQELASLMSGCGLPEAPKNSHLVNMPSNSKFY
uniref:CCHC-type domain-containing protein n=1 Tax=Panagrellus redivivus TaxID=6233 RepID=A0A7E4VTU2_PANRE